MVGKKSLYFIVSILSSSGFLYGIDIGNSTSFDATAYSNGPHIVHQACTDTHHIVYHTQDLSGTYVGIYDLLHYRDESDYYIVHRGPIPPPLGYGDVAYPSVAIEPWVVDCHGDPQHPIAAIAYLTNVDNTYIVPTGTPWVSLYYEGQTPHWLEPIPIPMEEGFAGPPSIIGYRYIHYEIPSISVIFLVTFAHYNFCPPDEDQQIEIWAVTIPVTGGGTPTTHHIRTMDFVEGCTSPSLVSPSTAVFLEYDLSGGNPIPVYVWLHTAWEGAFDNVRYAVTGFPYDYYIHDIDDSRGPISLESDNDHIPFIDNYGDQIFLTWRRGGMISGEIRLRERDANYSDDQYLFSHWTPSYPDNLPWNMSQSSTHSDWPQCHSYTAVWQERVPPDEIRLRNFDLESGPAENYYTPSTTPGPDCYPHIASVAYLTFSHTELIEYVHILWTEGSTTPYDILFEDLTLAGWSLFTTSPPGPTNRIHIDPNVPVYYEIKCGNPQASYYCEKRDSYGTFSGHSVDIGNEELVYNLPLLISPYHYLVRAIVSVPQSKPGSSTSISEILNLGGEEVVIAATSEKPETLDYILPQNVYYRDWGTKLKITGSKGAYLEDIKVYRFETREPAGERDYRAIISDDQSIPSDNFTLSPTLFSLTLNISYQVARKERIALEIYDASGRLVRTLIHASVVSPGTYTLTWDGKGTEGKMLPAGIYFIRFKTEDRLLTKKAVLMR